MTRGRVGKRIVDKRRRLWEENCRYGEKVVGMMWNCILEMGYRGGVKIIGVAVCGERSSGDWVVGVK